MRLPQEITHEYHERCSMELFGTPSPPRIELSRSELMALLAVAPRAGERRMSISGNQPKLAFSVRDGGVVLDSMPTTHIMKPSPEPFPHCAENEHTMMLCMKAMGVPTPPVGLLRLADGELVYVVKRFDADNCCCVASPMRRLVAS
jgi:serine/threonine-protein kinase HipA